MKVIERSPIGSGGGTANPFDRVRGIWKFGLAWNRDLQAQNSLIKSLGNSLDNTYTIISNVNLPGFNLPVPLVLIGQTGVRTLYACGAEGIFRVKGEHWFKLDEQEKRYKLSRSNLVRRTELMSRAVIDYLGQNSIYLDESESVLFFSQPGVHVDVPESPVRILQIDGVNSYAVSLKDEKTVLDAMEIHHITDILTKSKTTQVKSSEGLVSLKPPSDMVGYGDFKLKVWQWILLFILAILMLITVIITAVIIVGAT